MSDYPPIGDYALIGDCRAAGLVSRDGGLDWLCLPHFSGKAFFAALLDRDQGGEFTIRPEADSIVSRRYVDGTAVLETTFRTETGEVRLFDMMTMVGERHGALEPQREVLRLIEMVSGEVDLDVVYAPRPDFGRAHPRLARCGALGWALENRSQLLLLHTDADLRLDTNFGVVSGRIRLKAGERRAFSLTFVERDPGVVLPLGDDAWKRKDATIAWWHGWSGRCRPMGRHHDAVLRSIVTLKLLTFSLSGAVIAAPTASLPETIGGARNWDYRFCWLRDASLTLESFLELGYREEADAFLNWLLHATRLTWPQLQVLYDVYGEAQVPEQHLDHLDGYAGSKPVRIGNGAWDQLQLDAYGSVIVAAATYCKEGGRLDAHEKRLLKGLGKCVCRLWKQADQGIWEMRGPPRHFTHSKLMCWAALDCLLYLHDNNVLEVPALEFRRERDDIRRRIDAEAYRPGLGYGGELGESRWEDAALLTMPHYRFLAGGDPKLAETFSSIDTKLGRDGLLWRYPPEIDGMEGEEAAFGICSFWGVEVLARMGRVEESERRFERLLGFGNDLGLFAEEIDALTGDAIGNFPQAFTHVGLIQAALALQRARNP